jgi:hypothetical protein
MDSEASTGSDSGKTVYRFNSQSSVKCPKFGTFFLTISSQGEKLSI